MKNTIARLLLPALLLWSFVARSQIVRTLAGNGTMAGPFTGEGTPAITSAIGSAHAVCVDTAGNIYFTDEYNKVVKKISRNGILTTIAGNGVPSSATNTANNGDGGPATAARIVPQPIIIDSIGNLYIGDVGIATVRKITPAGIITTVAGNRGIITISGDGGPATAAGLGGVSGLAFDGAGNLYIADANTRVRKVNAAGIISTVVGGSGAVGYTGDGGPATAAASASIVDVCFDHSGNMFIADQGNSVVRKITPAGIISRYAGLATSAGTTGDGGQATLAKFLAATSVEVDRAGILYVTDQNRIRMINPATGVISTYAGAPASGFAGDCAAPSTTTRFNFPIKLSFDKNDNMFIPERGPSGAGTPNTGRRIRQIIRSVDTFHISVSPSNLLCGNTLAVFTAHARNAYYRYRYQWLVNGYPVGTNSPVYTSPMTHNNDTVVCNILDTTCSNYLLAKSDTIIMTVLPPVTPALTVTSTGDTVCLGLPITFNATAINGGTTPTFQWYVFGAPYFSGPTFTYTPLVGQIVSCVLTSSEACATLPTDTVHRVLSVIPSFHPYALVTASPDSNLAHWGEIVTFMCDLTYSGSAPTFQWYNSAGPIPGATSVSYFQEMYGPDYFYCVVHSNGYCAVPNIDTSNIVHINTGTLGVGSTPVVRNSYTIYPNPGDGNFTIAGRLDNSYRGDIKISVRNMLGQTLYTTLRPAASGTFEHHISLPGGTPPGVYFADIDDGTHKEVRRFVVR